MRRLAPTLAALLLASCAGPRPPVPPRAAVTAPAAWRGGEPHALAVDPQWWRQFHDPALDALVSKALDANLDLLTASARVEEARAQWRLTASRSHLTLDLGAQGAGQRNLNAFGLGVDQALGQGLASASYEVDLFGRLAASTRAARLRLLASQEARDTVRIALEAAIANGYIRLRALDAQLAIAQETLATRAAGLKLIERRVAAGYAPALDGQQARAEYETAAQLVPSLQLAITQQENGLRLLLGDTPGPVTRGAALGDWAPFALPSALPAQLLRQRPDIAQAEALLAASDRDLDAARAAFMPRINLTASGGAVDSTLIANPVSLFAMGGSILAPILSGGALRAQEAGAAARRDQAAFAYRKAALSAFAQVENTMAAITRLDQQQTAAAGRRDALAGAFKLADERYRAGYAPYLERLDAERNLLSARLTVVDLQAQHLQAIVSLNESLGGGWSASTDTIPPAQ